MKSVFLFKITWWLFPALIVSFWTGSHSVPQASLEFNNPASASHLLGLQVWSTTLFSHSLLNQSCGAVPPQGATRAAFVWSPPPLWHCSGGQPLVPISLSKPSAWCNCFILKHASLVSFQMPECPSLFTASLAPQDSSWLMWHWYPKNHPCSSTIYTHSLSLLWMEFQLLTTPDLSLSNIFHFIYRHIYLSFCHLYLVI